jgi:hypothetical protein
MATVQDLRMRYPALRDVAADDIQYWLTDALRTVGPSWGDDADVAQIALAAHNLVVNDMPGIRKTEAEQLPAGVTKFKSASMDVQISETAANRLLGTGYNATRYGQEFAALLRRHAGGPILAGYVEPRGRW